MSESCVGWRRADAEASAALGALIKETAHGITSAAGQRTSPVQSSQTQSSQTQSSPVQPPLWSETETKAFIGEAGSLTSAHVDIAPQLEVAHGLAGVQRRDSHRAYACILLCACSQCARGSMQPCVVQVELLGGTSL